MKVQLQVIEGPENGRAFTFAERDRFVIGRAPTAHFQIPQDLYFSRHHAMLDINPPDVLLQDLGSTNGTLVNGTQIRCPTVLRNGDTISGGGTRIRVEIEAPPEPEARVPVRCGLCGMKAPNESPRARSEKMAFYCEPCQEKLLRQPRLPNGYELVKELGRGAMGAVYLVQGPLGKRAMKMMLPKAAMSEKMRKMFLREGATQAALNHPRIVRVHELYEPVPGVFCLAMEYVDGTSAERLLESEPHGLNVRVACTIAIQALEGLAHAHARTVVHRDIKEANLLVERGFGVRLADFGLAKSYEASGASGLTATSGEMAGTLPYMPPEQILDYRNVKPPADVYAMGATLYRLLTGQFAYDFKPTGNAFVTILEDPIVPVRSRTLAVPDSVALVVETAMRKESAERYATAEQMRLALEEAIRSVPETSQIS